MKIAIVTPYYLPLPVPRAIRAAELAHEFIRLGHDVTVYNLTSPGKDFSPAEQSDVNVRNMALMPYDRNASTQNSRGLLVRLIKRPWINRILFYFTLNSGLLLQRKIERQLTIAPDTDLVISIGLPFAVHWGVAKVLKEMNFAGTAIADYGDPFSHGNRLNVVAPYFRTIERRVLKQFKYVTVPVSAAIPAFLPVVSSDRLKVIPQGFTLKEFSLKKYIPSDTVTFGFAGRVYPLVRDPRPFLDYLCTRKSGRPVRFVMYVDPADAATISLITSYKERLGDKLELRHPVPRKDVIHELSGMDFLINIENLSTTQVPSKLVDYTLAGRPILCFTSDSFSPEKFEAFCNGDYTGSQKVDIEPFDIRTVARQFLDLASHNLKS